MKKSGPDIVLLVQGATQGWANPISFCGQRYTLLGGKSAAFQVSRWIHGNCPAVDMTLRKLCMCVCAYACLSSMDITNIGLRLLVTCSDLFGITDPQLQQAKISIWYSIVNPNYDWISIQVE